jgi:hypothetical protein
MDKSNIKTKFNSVITGTIIGLVVPCVTVFLFYAITPTDKTFTNFIHYAVTFQILTRLISICAIPNLVVFFFLMNRNKLFAARGIILATFIITFGVIIMKGFIE